MVKYCKKCEALLDTSHFHKNKKSTDRFKSKCIDCCRVHAIFYYINNPEKREAKNKNNRDKYTGYNKEYYDKNREHLLEYGSEYRKKKRRDDPNFRDKELSRTQQWRIKNPDKIKSASNIWKEINKEYSKEKRKIYLSNPEAKRKVKESQKNWINENPDKRRQYRKNYKEKHGDEINERDRARRLRVKDTPEFKIAKRHNETKRKRILRNTETDITKEWLLSLWNKTTHCSITGLELNIDGNKYPEGKHLDHIVPINMGGTHTMDNVRFISHIANLQRPKDGRDILLPYLWYTYIILELQKRVKRRP